MKTTRLFSFLILISLVSNANAQLRVLSNGRVQAGLLKDNNEDLGNVTSMQIYGRIGDARAGSDSTHPGSDPDPAYTVLGSSDVFRNKAWQCRSHLDPGSSDPVIDSKNQKNRGGCGGGFTHRCYLMQWNPEAFYRQNPPLRYQSRDLAIDPKT